MYEGFLTDLECDHLISLVSANYSISSLGLSSIWKLFPLNLLLLILIFGVGQRESAEICGC